MRTQDIWLVAIVLVISGFAGLTFVSQNRAEREKEEANARRFGEHLEAIINGEESEYEALSIRDPATGLPMLVPKNNNTGFYLPSEASN